MSKKLIDAFNMVNTPAYVFDAEEFRVRADTVQRALSGIDLCYSIKANPFLLSVLPDTFSKIEVCSPGELKICRHLGIEPEMIIFSGLNKSRTEIEEAVDYGVRTLTAESRSHLVDEISVAHDKGVNLDILIRITDDSQFGIDKDEIIELIQEFKLSSVDSVRVVGFHFFTGTGKRKAREIERELSTLLDTMVEIRGKTGLTVNKLEYGTGMGVQYFDGAAEELHEAEMSLLSEVAATLESFREELKDRYDDVELTVEMGRFFAASCGHYVTKVIDTKVNQGTHYAIIDGGSHQMHYDGQMQGMKLPLVTQIKMNGKVTGALADGMFDFASPTDSANAYTIAGSLCTTADVLTRMARLDDIDVGDRLVFHKTGAYSVYEGMSLFLSRDLPSVYMLHADGKVELFRDRIETYTYNTK